MSHRWSKKDRLRTHGQYVALQRRGRRIHGRCFLAVIAPNCEGRRRLGVTVGRRVGGAVARNRVKRRIREYFRRNRELLGPNLDINVIAKPHAGNVPTRHAQEDLRRIFEKTRS